MNILLILLPLLAPFLFIIGLVLMSLRPMGADRYLFPKCDPVEKLAELTLGIKSKQTRDEDACFRLGLICLGTGVYLLIALARLPLW